VFTKLEDIERKEKREIEERRRDLKNIHKHTHIYIYKRNGNHRVISYNVNLHRCRSLFMLVDTGVAKFPNR